MLLKKQTVWLLTMLSLVVVLSVYYITSPEQQPTDMAAVGEQKEEKTEKNADEKGTNKEIDEDISQDSQAPAAANEKDMAIISNAAGDEVFETLRMQLMDERSKMKEELTKTIASTELSAEERSKAKEKMDELNDIAQKEYLLETLIKAMDYEDVLVRAEGNQVSITVKAEKQSRSEANKIIQTVRSELGPLHAVVEFQNTK
ncbi:SpoIIIAH-like family protein [Bacillus benzoevorans]|uniref:Stage III sporulation protein AH n=1 Tax=Bacillus benzoevorans TaxID=1456 RepID=A0A7X0HQ39_9BACI|nr:SpoIIIAH-like family protein [Bacillus benzoevorans]MBB6444877.1 stage III sporulation protein AH [Bacillus benzoevorans]